MTRLNRLAPRLRDALAVGALLSLLMAAGVAPASAQMLMNGAGATFPYPIYSKWFDEYHKVKPDVAINYQSIGSGGGIRQLTAQTVFFGATDGPMTNEQQLAAPGKVLHFPVVLVDREFWQGLVDDWIAEEVQENGLISPDDERLLFVTDDLDEAVQIVLDCYQERCADVPVTQAKADAQ